MFCRSHTLNTHMHSHRQVCTLANTQTNTQHIHKQTHVGLSMRSQTIA